MRLDSALVAGLALCVPASASAPAPRSVTLYLPAAPNPFGLAARTHATLDSLGAHLSAPLSAVNAFVFANVTPGSYLADVHCPSDAFGPLRVDVPAAPDEPVAACETFRANDWANKGEALPLIHGSAGPGFELRHRGSKNYYVPRPTCARRPRCPRLPPPHPPSADPVGFAVSVFAILKNPMILMGAVSMLLFVGMPYLIENSEPGPPPSRSVPLAHPFAVDPDMKAEFEEQQRKGPMAAMMGGGQPGGNPLGEFDMAAFLAGSKKKAAGSAGDTTGEPSRKSQSVRR